MIAVGIAVWFIFQALTGKDDVQVKQSKSEQIEVEKAKNSPLDEKKDKVKAEEDKKEEPKKRRTKKRRTKKKSHQLQHKRKLKLLEQVERYLLWKFIIIKHYS